MNIYELYFEDAYFKEEVDTFVAKHMTTHTGAFKCMEIKEAYERRLYSIYHTDIRRAKNERIQRL